VSIHIVDKASRQFAPKVAISHGIPKFTFLVIPQKSAGPREAGWLDECPPEILRGAQDDSLGFVILSTAKDLWRPYGNHQGFWNEKVGGV